MNSGYGMTVHEAAQEIRRLRNLVAQYEEAVTTLLLLSEAYSKCLTLTQQIVANEFPSSSSDAPKTN